MAEETNREEQSTKKKSEPKAEMSFLDHLEALRWHFLKSISAIIVGGVVAFIYSDFVWNSIILAPNSPDFWTSRMLIKLGDFIGVKSTGLNQHPIELINFDLSGQFMVDVVGPPLLLVLLLLSPMSFISSGVLSNRHFTKMNEDMPLVQLPLCRVFSCLGFYLAIF